jgi:signal transduction histidine kinase
VPGGIIQLNMLPDRTLSTDFISDGMLALNPFMKAEDWQESPELYFTFIHPDDLDNFRNQFMALFKKKSYLQIEYRVKIGSEYRWHCVNGNSEKMSDGSITLYGIIHDINNRIEYELAMEQIAFDISHVLRRPVTTLLGFSNLIEKDLNITASKLIDYMKYIKIVSQELDEYTRSLDKIYQKKSELITSQKNK